MKKQKKGMKGLSLLLVLVMVFSLLSAFGGYTNAAAEELYTEIETEECADADCEEHDYDRSDNSIKKMDSSDARALKRMRKEAKASAMEFGAKYVEWRYNDTYGFYIASTTYDEATAEAGNTVVFKLPENPDENIFNTYNSWGRSWGVWDNSEDAYLSDSDSKAATSINQSTGEYTVTFNEVGSYDIDFTYKATYNGHEYYYLYTWPYTITTLGDDTDTEPVVPTTYTVSFNANGGSLGSNSSSRTITSGNTVGSLPGSPTRKGYLFDGWYTSIYGGSMVYSYTTVTSDMVIYAHWSKVSTRKPKISYSSIFPSSSKKVMISVSSDYDYQDASYRLYINGKLKKENTDGDFNVSSLKYGKIYKVQVAVASKDSTNSSIWGARSSTKKLMYTKLNATSVSLKAGKSKTLKLKGVSGKKAKWKSSKSKVVSVSKKGKLKAKKAGKAKITVKYGGKKYKCKVTVTAVKKTAPKKTTNTYKPVKTTPTYSTCTTCGGRGKVSGKCSRCGGRGKITVGRKVQSCSNCGGSGRVSSTCSRCGGSGRIKK